MQSIIKVIGHKILITIALLVLIFQPFITSELQEVKAAEDLTDENLDILSFENDDHDPEYTDRKSVV